MNRRHYHVIENTPGYMPDTEGSTHTNRREAESYAASLARELREDGYKIDGSARRGYLYAERDNWDLGRVIEINDCLEDCDLDN